MPGQGQGDGAVDGSQHRPAVGRIGLSGLDRHRQGQRQHGEGGVEARGGLPGIADLGDGHLQPEPQRQPAQPAGVVDGHERRHRPPVPGQPGHQGQFAADTGGFAHGQGENRLAAHIRTST